MSKISIQDWNELKDRMLADEQEAISPATLPDWTHHSQFRGFAEVRDRSGKTDSART